MKRNNKLWLFDGGGSFSGNPKWLYMYMLDNHKDIQCYWVSRNQETIKYVKSLGFKACTYNSLKGKRLMKNAGVYVVNQVKEIIPDQLQSCTILNLWHGVGCKSIERKVTSGFLNGRIAKKYIMYNELYKKNQLFLVTSPLMEKHFKEQCGIDDDKVIRAGYPCCEYQGKVKTYDHDILKQKGLPQNTKIAIYSPTYRDNAADDFFGIAIPDMDKLVDKLEKNNMLLIFKMHPLMNNDSEYIVLKEHYKNHPRLLFWDNAYDVYEIFDQITLGIVDYSSIFYDMLASHVPYFIRYVFDYDNPVNFRDLVFDYEEMTFGTMAKSFEDLLLALDSYENSLDEERNKVNNLFWEYASHNSLEKIVKETLAFHPHLDYSLKTLYSFDIFDTLICRNTDLPEGIFYYVQHKMQKSHYDFPTYMIEKFKEVRMSCENNVRERKRKNPLLLQSKEFEISLHEIYQRIQEIYHLTDEQVSMLEHWEIEAEIENTAPINDRVEYVHQLVKQGEKVVLISDMYLSEDVIKAMLVHADPLLATLPLYLSNTYKVQKTTKELFYKVYHDIDYNHYKRWIHYGDSPVADKKMPQTIGIETVNHELIPLNDYENQFIDVIRTYDSYLVAKLLKTYRLTKKNQEEIFSYCYASMYYVPYVSWAIKDAMRRGLDTLYFISRDGHYLKIAADAIIKQKNLKMKTKYIYGSRKAWRLPSFINEVDDEFYKKYGNFADVKNFQSLLKALCLNEKEFDMLMPQLGYLKKVKYTANEMNHIVKIFKNSKSYNQYIVKKAAELRPLILEYFNQEIDFNEKFAFVEYWGRGYTQTCMHRLLKEANSQFKQTVFYYARSIYGSEGDIIRRNYTSNKANLTYVEALFANVPYMTVQGYIKENGVVKPIIYKKQNNHELHLCLEKNIAKFATDLYSLHLLDEDDIEREMYNFSLTYYSNNPNDYYIINNIAPLKDSVTLNTQEREYAPKLTIGSFFNILKGKKIEKNTTNLDMTLGRSNRFYQWLYRLKVKLNEFEFVRKIGRFIRRNLAKFRKKTFTK